MRATALSTFLILFFIIGGCKRNPLKVDISGIKVSITINRLDKDIFDTPPVNEENIARLEKKYGNFFLLYSFNIIGSSPLDPDYPEYAQIFLADDMILKTKHAVDSIFPKVEFLEKELSMAFRYYKYYFPEKKIPNIYTCISGFNQSITVDKNILAISLDKYLGKECKFYAQLGWARYSRENMHPGRAAVDAMRGWVASELLLEGNNLLANMIHKGKINYFLDAMFPDLEDHAKIGYKPEQIEWCKRHEHLMWGVLVERDVLYSTEAMIIRRYTDVGPNTSYFTNESPGGAGAWIGWQIVREFMRRNPEISLNELMKEQDYQKILSSSKYSP